MKKVAVFLIYIVFFFVSHSQEQVCLWYNVENMFDTQDDTLKLDEEFLEGGVRNWNQYKLQTKINAIGKACLISAENKPIVFIGLCEVENRNVVNKLIYASPLSGLKMKAIHKESPDKRGIDVALLYNPRLFQPVDTAFIRINLANRKTTRDILYCKGIYRKKDTISIFLNHWPSKYGGSAASEDKRITAQKTLRDYIAENVLDKEKVVVMGDFNETHLEKAVERFFNDDKIKEMGFMNITNEVSNAKGSYKYQGIWQFIDQIWISKALHSSSAKASYLKINVCKSDLLLEEDKTYTGLKPFRTFNGYKYNGGFSDHLPLVLTLTYK